MQGNFCIRTCFWIFERPWAAVAMFGLSGDYCGMSTNTPTPRISRERGLPIVLQKQPYRRNGWTSQRLANQIPEREFVIGHLLDLQAIGLHIGEQQVHDACRWRRLFRPLDRASDGYQGRGDRGTVVHKLGTYELDSQDQIDFVRQKCANAHIPTLR